MNNSRQNFQSLIRRVLTEELKKRDALTTRVPEQTGNGLNSHVEDSKTFSTDENSRDTQTKDSLLSDLAKIVHDIDDKYLVVWDDHDDLKIDARDLMSFRITPDWEDHYEIEVLTRNEDRVWVTGLDWDQVKDFVKTNLDNANKKPTYVEKAYDKSYRNRQDQTKSNTKTGPIKSEKVNVKSVGDTKNKEKDYNLPDVKNEDDLPNKPMAEVAADLKRQADHKVQDPVKLRRKNPDKKLVVKPK